MNTNDALPVTVAPPRPFVPFLPVEGESPAAFEALLMFRSMPKRTLAKLAEMTMVSESTIRDWSAKFKWSERILAHHTQLMNTCMAQEAAASMAAVKAFREKLTRLTDHLINLGQVVIDNQVVLNPVQVKIVDGIRIIQAGVKLVQAQPAQTDHQDLMSAHYARLTALTDEFEQNLHQGKLSVAPAAENASPLPASEPTSSPLPLCNTPPS